jgi:hypothetical protein
MSTEFAKPSADVQVPGLIVGGGGSGLACSMLLARPAIETLLISAPPTASILPTAHELDQRTREILGDVDGAEQIYARSTLAEMLLDPDRLGPASEAWLSMSPVRAEIRTNLPRSRSKGTCAWRLASVIIL